MAISPTFSIVRSWEPVDKRILQQAKSIMWCSNCQQDAPAEPNFSNGESDLRTLICPRCGEVMNQELTSDELLRVAEVSDEGIDLTSLDGTCSKPPLSWDSWELDDELRRAEWMTRKELTPLAANERPAGAWLEPFHRAAQSAEDQAAVIQRMPNPPSPALPAPVAQKSGVSILAWLAMSLGIVAFAFGVALLVWSRIESRPEYWDVGLSAALGGQFLLLLGVLFWIDRLSRARAAAAQASESPTPVVLQPTILPSPAIDSPASAFYAHLAGGAHPQRMVANLQGQLDLLAQRISSLRP